MPIPTRLPDLDHWKAQVLCQAGCPVATDAGRYVQLIAAGRDEEAFLVARAPNPFDPSRAGDEPGDLRADRPPRRRKGGLKPWN